LPYSNAVVADALAAYGIEEHQRLGATVKLGGARAVQQYLQELRQDNRRLPLRSGKPNRLAIARACGIDRKVLYGNREAVTLLEAFVREQSAIGN
jgi:ABC-type taurine transport system ATPase subunit